MLVQDLRYGVRMLAEGALVHDRRCPLFSLLRHRFANTVVFNVFWMQCLIRAGHLLILNRNGSWNAEAMLI